MLVAKAEYRVKADFAARNLANIRAFLPEARRRLRTGSSYSVAIGEDGVSFLHLFFHEDASEGAMLGAISAFATFLSELMEGGCEAPPAIAHYEEL